MKIPNIKIKWKPTCFGYRSGVYEIQKWEEEITKSCNGETVIYPKSYNVEKYYYETSSNQVGHFKTLKEAAKYVKDKKTWLYMAYQILNDKEYGSRQEFETVAEFRYKLRCLGYDEKEIVNLTKLCFVIWKTWIRDDEYYYDYDGNRIKTPPKAFLKYQIPPVGFVAGTLEEMSKGIYNQKLMDVTEWQLGLPE